MHVYYITYMATPQHKNPCPRSNEIYNFGRPFIGHHYNILGLSDLCLGVKKKIFKEKNAFSLYDLHPGTRTPAPGVMKFTIFVEPSLVIISTYLVYLIHALIITIDLVCLSIPRSREDDFYRNIAFSLYYLYGNPLPQE